MNTVQRIAKNTGVLLFAKIASYILGFFFVMYTARYSGAEGFCTDHRLRVTDYALPITHHRSRITNLTPIQIGARNV